MRVFRWLCVVFVVPVAYSQGLPNAPGMSEKAGPVVRRFEVGGQFSDVAFAPCATRDGCLPAPPTLALGPGATWNLNEHFAIDSTLNIFAGKEDFSTDFPDGSVAGGRGLEFLVGPRAEVRGGRLGIFVDSKAGFLHWSQVLTDEFFVPQPGGGTIPHFVGGGGTYFSIGLGAGLEYTVTPRTHLRVEAGDREIDYRRAEDVGCGVKCASNPTAWDSNAELTIGLYTALGKVVGRPRPALDAQPLHRFFDATNLLGMSVSLLAQTSDAVTTQRFLHHGVQEQNGLARPFVDQGWGGQVAAAAIVNTAEISVMYALHKMGHHRMERALPYVVAVPGAIEGYRNLHER